nr:hypothetical protein [Tanacetum cinerariifolium]
PPNKVRKFKKPASPQLTTILFSPEEPTKKSKRVKRPAKKSSKAPAGGVVIRETLEMPLSKKKENMTVEKRKRTNLLSEVALTKEAHYEKVRKKSLRDFYKTHPSGSGNVTKTAPSATKIKPSVTNEGTGVKPGVLDESRSEGSDQDKDSGDDITQSDNEKGDDEKEEDDEFVRNPFNDFHDETKIYDKAEGDEDEEMDYTTSQLYDDVDIWLNKLVQADDETAQKEGATPPNKVRKFKKPASPQLTTILFSPEEPTKKSKRVKGPRKKFSNAPAGGVVIRETPEMPLSKKKEKMTVEKRKRTNLLSEVALTKEAHYEKVRKKSLRDFYKTHPSGSGNVTKPAPSATKIKPSVTNEGNGVKLGVPDVIEEESSKKIGDDEKEEDDEFVRNPFNDFHDETKIYDKAEGDEDEEMDYTTSQLYDDDDPFKTQVTALVDEHLDARLGATRDEFMNFLSASITARITKQVKNQLPQILPKEVSNFSPSTEKPEFEVADLDMPQDQKENPINDDEEPKGKETVLGPAFKLLKGTLSNYAELEYDFEECFKALLEKLNWDIPKGGDYPFDLTKLLPLVMNGNHQMDITKNIYMEYLPKRRYITLEKKQANIMIKAINKQLKERRMMRSLKKFIGRRHYRTDLRYFNEQYDFVILLKMEILLEPTSSKLLVDVAVLPRDQRHLWLCYQVEGYTEEIDWAERLRMGYTMDDGKEIFVSHAWKRLFKILTPLVRPPPSYTLIRDLVLRLCHRMMVHIITGRSQAPEKVTVTDLFYLRALDVRSDVAVLPRDQRHLWLCYQVEGYTEEIDWAERLRMGYNMDDGKEIFVSHAWKRLFEILTPLVRGSLLGGRAGLLSQEGDAGGVAEEALVEPTGGDEDEEMPQAAPSSPRT